MKNLALKTEATSDVAKNRRANLRLIKAAEKRLQKRRLDELTNSDHIRFLAVTALRSAKCPLSLYVLMRSFREALRFKIRSEFLLMALMQKREQTGIVLLPLAKEIKFTLRENIK